MRINKTTGLGELSLPPIDSAHFQKNKWRKQINKIQNQSHPISGVTNIHPLIELLNTIAKDKYLVKTLYNAQVRVQSTESSIYTAIVKALIDKNTESHTYKPRQDRIFRVVLKNIHPSTDVNNIKQDLKDKEHEV